MLDENLPAAQQQLLRKWRIRFRFVGVDVASSGTEDENLIPILRRLPHPTFFTLDFYLLDWIHLNYSLVWLDVRRREAAEFIRRFRWLWPTVFAVAQLKLQPSCPGKVEDVAIEALEELVEKVRQIQSVDELKPLAASIAHHRAVSLLRERFAKKRGAGKTVSLDAPSHDEGYHNEPASGNSPFHQLEQSELAQRLGAPLAELKPPLGEILSDFFLHELRYEEICRKDGMAVGSFGVYLKRGL